MDHSAGVSDTWAFSLAYSSIFRAIISRHGPSSLSKAFTSRTEKELEFSIFNSKNKYKITDLQR